MRTNTPERKGSLVNGEIYRYRLIGEPSRANKSRRRDLVTNIELHRNRKTMKELARKIALQFCWYKTANKIHKERFLNVMSLENEQTTNNK